VRDDRAGAGAAARSRNRAPLVLRSVARRDPDLDLLAPTRVRVAEARCPPGAGGRTRIDGADHRFGTALRRRIVVAHRRKGDDARSHAVAGPRRGDHVVDRWHGRAEAAPCMAPLACTAAVLAAVDLHVHRRTAAHGMGLPGAHIGRLRWRLQLWLLLQLWFWSRSRLRLRLRLRLRGRHRRLVERSRDRGELRRRRRRCRRDRGRRVLLRQEAILTRRPQTGLDAFFGVGKGAVVVAPIARRTGIDGVGRLQAGRRQCVAARRLAQPGAGRRRRLAPGDRGAVVARVAEDLQRQGRLREPRA